MEKPFDVSIEQLAHDLAIITVTKFSNNADKPFTMLNYYEEYVNEYKHFKELITMQVKVES